MRRNGAPVQYLILLPYIRAWKREGKCGRKEAEKGCSGQKKRGGRKEKEMEGRGKYSYRIKMQAVRKARKNNSPRMKRHTFLQKQGNIQKVKTDRMRKKEKKRGKMPKMKKEQSPKYPKSL